MRKVCFMITMLCFSFPSNLQATENNLSAIAVPSNLGKLVNTADYSQQQLRIQQYIPAQQYQEGWEKNWTDMVSVLAWDKAKAPSAAQYLQANLLAQSAECNFPVTTHKMDEYIENNYPTRMFFSACQQVKAHGASEVTFFKTIESKNNLVVIWISKKNITFVDNKPQLEKNLLPEWRQLLDTIYLRTQEQANPPAKVSRQHLQTQPLQHKPNNHGTNQTI